MKILITVLVVAAIAAAGWFFLMGDEANNTPTPSAAVSPSVSPTPSASANVSPSVSPAGSRTPTPTGTPFTLANVRVTTPRPHAVINSPLIITGQVRGSWMFEASFPITLRDSTGKVLAQGVGMTSENWMTSNFVSFTSTLTFTKPTNTDTGTLVFHKDNPSGLPENDASVSFPIRFR